MIEHSDPTRLVTPAQTTLESSAGSQHALRPTSLKEFVGQTQLKENLRIVLKAAQQRQEPCDHLLFHGPPGLGKTTLAHVVAKEQGVGIHVTSGPAIERAGDLVSILTSLNEGDVLFIDEIHRLPRVVEETLYPAMEDGVIDITLGKGPAAQSLRLDVPTCTIVGATTRTGLLSSPLRDRFGVAFRLEFYSDNELQQVLARSAQLLEVKATPDGIAAIASRSRGTPRIANRLLRRVRDIAQVEHNGMIDQAVANDALQRLHIDHKGLDQLDRKLLAFIGVTNANAPIGLATLAASLLEEQDTISDVIEPYLLNIGLLSRTPRGRIVTEQGLKHISAVSARP